jgi:hypothetical protein
MQKTTYLRLYSDEQGESHFEEVALTLSPLDFAPPAAPLNFVSLFSTTACSLLGGSRDWGGDIPHPAPRRQLMCVLQGIAEIKVSDGEIRILPPGALVLVEDTTGKGHSSKFTSENQVVILNITL